MVLRAGTGSSRGGKARISIHTLSGRCMYVYMYRRVRVGLSDRCCSATVRRSPCLSCIPGRPERTSLFRYLLRMPLTRYVLACSSVHVLAYNTSILALANTIFYKLLSSPPLAFPLFPAPLPSRGYTCRRLTVLCIIERVTTRCLLTIFTHQKTHAHPRRNF